MENPCITFATPTLLAGDRSLADVIAHEIAHSWTGNLVTNITWEHFWLNEGWTVWLERKIMARYKGSDNYLKISAQIGWKHLEDDVVHFGVDNGFTKLVWPLSGEDPDDAFSGRLIFFLGVIISVSKSFISFIGIPYGLCKLAEYFILI
jgi:leukotriene-A4 hydrolase